MASLWKALRSRAEDGEAGARAGSVVLKLCQVLKVLLGEDPFVCNIYGITGPDMGFSPMNGFHSKFQLHGFERGYWVLVSEGRN